MSTEHFITLLKDMGFAAPATFPDGGPDSTLRPESEIGRRLFVIRAVSDWVCAPPERVSDDFIIEAVSRLQRGSSEAWTGKRERTILGTPRSVAQYVYRPWIGWAFEGAWALAWVLGYEVLPDIFGDQMDDDRVVDVILRFLPPVSTDVDAWLSSLGRTESRYESEATAAMCDALGLVDAASRAGRHPAWFHPGYHGRVIRERHRALVWALRPGATWDDVYRGGDP